MIDETIDQRYRLKAEIGAGGMGIVYHAHDTSLQRDVAVKLISKANLGTDGHARLIREAQSLAQLSHPNIVTIYDVGEYNGAPYIVTELVEGNTLDQAPPDSLEAMISVTKQVCRALQHAHAEGIVHRDLKPANVLVTSDGTAKLMDFGVARSLASQLTTEGMIVGTVFYMAPEQAMGRAVDARSDLYSLGVMLYELTTGQLPYEADDPVAVISQHVNAPLVPPRAREEAAPPALNDLIVNLMKKEPDERPRSAEDVLRLLESPSLLDARAAPSYELSLLERIAHGRLVGRSAEYENGRSHWEDALAGNRQLLLISGEPGIGKTRLMREIVTQAEVSGGHALIGEAYEESSAPYGPFAQIVRRALNRFSQDDLDLPEPVLADLLKLAPDLSYAYPDVTPNPQLDPEYEQQRLFGHVAAFCKILAGGAPLLLVVEDAHWADSGTLAMLQYLIRNVQEVPLMLLLTYREVELQQSRPFNELLVELNRQRVGTRVKLNRLDRERTRGVLAAIFSEDITDEFLEGIYRETGGNPFFIEEVCRALVESGKLEFRDGQWHRPSMEELEIPQSIQVAVEARLAKLPSDCQDTLRMAAILGREFDLDTLAAALDLEEDALMRALETAEAAQMIQSVDGKGKVSFSFLHALVQQGIVEGVRTVRRYKLHRQAAEAVEAAHPENYEALAYHYGLIGEEDQARKYHTLSGERALAAYANQDAEHHFRDALALVQDPGEKADLLANLGTAINNQGRTDEAIEVWREAIELFMDAENTDRAADLYARAGRAAWYVSGPQENLKICLEGLRELEGAAETPGMAKLFNETGRAYIFNGRIDEAKPFIEHALSIAEKLDVVDVQVEARIDLGISYQWSGEAERALAITHKAADLAEAHGLWATAARAHNNLATFYYLDIGDPQQAYHHVRRAYELVEKTGDSNQILFALGQWAVGEMETGNLDEADRLLASFSESDVERLGAFFYQRKGMLLHKQGDLWNAELLFREGLPIARRGGKLQQICSLNFYLGNLLTLEESWDEAEQALREASEVSQNHEMHLASLACLALPIAQNGNHDKAHELLADVEEIISNGRPAFPALHHAITSARLAAMEKRWGEAWDHFEEVIEHKDIIPWYKPHTRYLWAQAHLQRGEKGDAEQARELMKQAIEEFEAMGAAGWVDTLRGELAEMEGRA